MEWLNFHHLRYFWMAAREGNFARAAANLHVSQPAVSGQIQELEAFIGEKLFRREGRHNVLTEAGHVVFGYADEIFALSREMMNSVQQRPGARTMRLHVGVTDSIPKLVTNLILSPVFAMAQRFHVICREGKMEDLLTQLNAHRLDVILADEPVSSSQGNRTFSYPLGETGIVFCAEQKLGTQLKKNFPASLHGAPALLPAEHTSLRRAMNTWFHENGIEPHVVAEFDDLSLMKAMAPGGRGFIALPAIAMHDAVARYGYEIIGDAGHCRIQFYAITAERRIEHPALSIITSKARIMLEG